MHILHNAVEKCTWVFMIPSQMASLTQLFCAQTLPSFSFVEQACATIFFLRWPTEHVISKLLYGSTSMNHQ